MWGFGVGGSGYPNVSTPVFFLVPRGPLNWYRNMRPNWRWALTAKDRKVGTDPVPPPPHRKRGMGPPPCPSPTPFPVFLPSYPRS